MSVRPLWPIVRRMTLSHRFHDVELRLSWRQTVRLHLGANLLMLRRMAPTVVFVVVSIVPFVAWVGLAYAAAQAIPLQPESWTIFRDRFLDAMALGLLPYLLLQHVAFMIAIQATYAPIVREVLGRMGMPVCIACGQLLDAGASCRCPECGHA